MEDENAKLRNDALERLGNPLPCPDCAEPMLKVRDATSRAHLWTCFICTGGKMLYRIERSV